MKLPIEDFVRGIGQYVDDIKVPGLLYMAVARSPYARARVTSVEGGLNRSDLKAVIGGFGEGGRGDVDPMLLHPVFAQDYVNYEGQPVAAVFDNDRYSAYDRLAEVEVGYEEMKPILTISDALSGEPIHVGSKSNVIKQQLIGGQFADPDSPVVIEDSFSVGRIANNPMEPRGILANYDGSKLTVHISTQSVFSIKNGLCSVLGLDRSKVRVLQADTGGAFGLKSALYPEYVIAAYASMKYKKPVKWIESRSENLMVSQPGRGVVGEMKLFAEKSGRVTAVRGEVTTDAGAYGGTSGSSSPFFIAMQLTGPYGIERAQVLATSVMTNKPPQGAYRGAGRPEAAFFMERMMDLLADELQKEDNEVRLINTTTTPFKSPLGLEIEASRPFFEKALTELKYSERSKTEKMGLGFFVLVSAARPGESARIRSSGGAVEVWFGGSQHGQMHILFVKRILGEELDIPGNLVKLNRGDSDELKQGVGTWGSRSAVAAGAALTEAARMLRSKVERSLGSYSLENLLSEEFDAEVFRSEEEQINSFGANTAVVRINQFGVARVVEIGACYDIGRNLSPDVVMNQIIGGSVQGIGQALYESVVHDSEGKLATRDLYDAGLPIAENLPDFNVKIVEHPSKLPHGAKGLGEAPTIGVPIAVVRALEKTTMHRIRNTPVLPEELMDHKNKPNFTKPRAQS